MKNTNRSFYFEISSKCPVNYQLTLNRKYCFDVTPDSQNQQPMKCTVTSKENYDIELVAESGSIKQTVSFLLISHATQK